MRVCIVGSGIVNACGNNVSSVAKAFMGGHAGLSTVSGFADPHHPVKVAGVARSFSAAEAVNPRFAAKTDRFTHFALAASEAAMVQSELDLKAQDLSRAGIWFGNNSGGWDICERGFREMYLQGVEMINPWQATAWFPAAPQGFVSICHGPLGTSKSFVADRATGLVAVIHGARSLLRGENDWVLAGGTEAPITSFGATCYYETGEMAPTHPDRPQYHTIGPKAAGLVLGEGAAIVMLESPQSLAQRKGRSLGDIVGVAINTDPGARHHRRLSHAIGSALQQAGLGPGEIDLVFGEGNGIATCNAAENAALAEVFCGEHKKPLYTSIKGYTGHMYGAAGATEIVAALMVARYGKVPPTLHAEAAQAHWHLPLVCEAQSMRPRNVLILARAREGVNAVLIVQFSK